MRDHLAGAIIWVGIALCAAVFLFAALAWPVFGAKEPTLGLIIAVAIFGPFIWAIYRYTRP